MDLGTPAGMGQHILVILHSLRTKHGYKKRRRGTGGHRVHEQHEGYLASHSRFNETPRMALLNDLKVTFFQTLAQGDRVVIGIDANEDVCNRPFNHMLAELGLKETILDRYHTSSPPATCKKNTQRTAIDGLWVSAGITITQGEYCEYNSLCHSDHRSLWLDINFQEVYGYEPPNLPRIRLTRIHIKDPNCIDKYLGHVMCHVC